MKSMSYLANEELQAARLSLTILGDNGAEWRTHLGCIFRFVVLME